MKDTRKTPKLRSDLVLVFYGLALYLVMRFKNLEKKEICKILLIVLISILTNSFHYQKQCRWGKREYFINTIHYHNFENTRECFKTTSYEMDLSHDFFFRGLRAQVQNDVWGHLHRCTILLCVCMIDKTRLYQNQDIHDVGK